jgi:hypothetical protein
MLVRSLFCVCESPSQSIFECLNQFFMKLSKYIIAPEPISTTYFINLSHQFVCLYVYPPPFIAKQRLGKHVPAPTNTRNNRRIFGCVCLCLPLSLLGHNSIKTFPRHRKIVGGVVFYAIHVWNESRRLVLPRTSILITYGWSHCLSAWFLKPV